MRGRAYSLDLRERAMADVDAGLSAEAVAQKYRVSPWWVYKLKRQRRESGSIAPRQQGGHKPQALAGQEARLRDLVQQQPDATLEQLRERLGVSVALSVLWAALDRLGLTYKKTLRAAEQQRPDVEAQRQAWQETQAEWDITRLVFLDETGATTNLTRRYGRAPKGERLYGRVPHGHWKSTTFVAALRQDGLTAPMVTDGPMNGELFVRHVQQLLCPTLAPGDVVIMGSAHDSEKIVR